MNGTWRRSKIIEWLQVSSLLLSLSFSASVDDRSRPLRCVIGFVRWASAQVEIYAEIFRRQVYGADQDGKVIEESLEVTKAQGAMVSFTLTLCLPLM